MMDDLISRAAAIEHMKAMADCAKCDNYNYVRCRACSWNDAMNIVEELPAVDAAPVVHGRWIRYSEIFHDPEYTLVKCSVCGGESCCDAIYCPDCGAKMDGEADG